MTALFEFTHLSYEMGFSPIGIQVSLSSCIKVYGAHVLIHTRLSFVCSVFFGRNFGFCCDFDVVFFFILCPHTVDIRSTCAWLIVTITMLHDFNIEKEVLTQSSVMFFFFYMKIIIVVSHVYQCHIPVQSIETTSSSSLNLFSVNGQKQCAAKKKEPASSIERKSDASR